MKAITLEWVENHSLEELKEAIKSKQVFYFNDTSILTDENKQMLCDELFKKGDK